MNKRLEQKVNDYNSDYLDGDDVGKEYVLHCARHFYNLALDDMEMFAGSLTTNAHEMSDNHPDKKYCIGVDNTVQAVFDFINKLRK